MLGEERKRIQSRLGVEYLGIEERCVPLQSKLGNQLDHRFRSKSERELQRRCRLKGMMGRVFFATEQSIPGGLLEPICEG